MGRDLGARISPTPTVTLRLSITNIYTNFPKDFFSFKGKYGVPKLGNSEFGPTSGSCVVGDGTAVQGDVIGTAVVSGRGSVVWSRDPANALRYVTLPALRWPGHTADELLSEYPCMCPCL